MRTHVHTPQAHELDARSAQRRVQQRRVRSMGDERHRGAVRVRKRGGQHCERLHITSRAKHKEANHYAAASFACAGAGAGNHLSIVCCIVSVLAHA